MGGTPSHVGGRASGRERGANERRDDRKMISPQISHHLKRTNPKGDKNRERKSGESGLEAGTVRGEADKVSHSKKGHSLPPPLRSLFSE